MLDIVLYDDSHLYNLDDYLATIDGTKYLHRDFGEIHYILPSLLRDEENTVLQLHIDECEHCSCTIILRAETILRENIIFPNELIISTMGLEAFKGVLRGDKVLFLKEGLRICDTNEETLPEDPANFDLSGTIIETKHLLYLMDRLHYHGMLTSDMLYLYFLSFPKYHTAKKMETKNYDYICHYPSLCHFYNHLATEVSKDMEYTDKGDLVRQIVKIQKDSF